MTDTTVHYRGRYLDLIERQNWEYVTRPNASAVTVLVAVTDQNEILLVEQLRKPLGCRVLELPAGLVGDLDDPNETVLEAAGRELEEETGYTAGALHLLRTCPTSAGMTDEIISFVRASQLVQTGPGGGDASEDIEVHAVPLSGVDDWLEMKSRQGTPLDPKIWSALYWVKMEKGV